LWRKKSIINTNNNLYEHSSKFKVQKITNGLVGDVATVGITHFAQKRTRDIVYVEVETLENFRKDVLAHCRSS
jgi:glycine cleavage system H lipoate-binding protein